MMNLDKLTKKGPAIEIKKLVIEEKIESAGLSWFRWHVLRVEYFAGSNKTIHFMVGPDKKSSWFENREEAESTLQKIKNIEHSKITPFGNHLLIDKLSKNRCRHYAAMAISGSITMTISILLVLTEI
ncbi:MAG: hypothetical protein Q4F13_01645 [Pseudomonadota bacterium]|nr:hypothetical protein [Pseudomonadota bacterium]